MKPSLQGELDACECPEARAGLRERTRLAAQREIADAALGLFASRGYDATTIDDIAAPSACSQRSVFRNDSIASSIDRAMASITPRTAAAVTPATRSQVTDFD